MGIHNLLPFVKKACREGFINEFSGCSIAVDVSCLLHRGLFGCMESVAQGKETKFYIYYVSKHIKALLDLNCHVIMVFDGRPLPAKKNTNEERRQRRVENLRAGELLMSEGKKDEAVDRFKRATSITPDIVENTIEHFRGYKNVDILVSPYESDAQLAFLVSEGLADVVFTEDSDLIAFGCEKIAFKWNCESGSCVIYEKKNLPRCFSGVMSSQFDFTKFRRICILSGCDYLQAGLPGIGLNKALSFFSKTSRTDLRTLLPRIPSYLNMSKLTVSKEFIEEFIRAENTFIHQVVFDPRQRCQRPLTPYPLPSKADQKQVGENDDDFVVCDEKKHLSDFSYAGEVLSSNLAMRLAMGNQFIEKYDFLQMGKLVVTNVLAQLPAPFEKLSVTRKQPMNCSLTVSIEKSVIADKFFLPSPIPKWSIWCDGYESYGKRKRRSEELQKREEKKCGSAFKFDSPSRKRIKLDSSQIFQLIEKEEEVAAETSSSQTEQKISQNDSSQGDNSSRSQENEKTVKPVGGVKQLLLKNRLECSYTVDEMMKTYGAKRDENFATTIGDLDDDTPKTVTKTMSISTSSSSTLGRSAYFTKRSASCANPFRKPIVEVPVPETKSIAKEQPEKRSDAQQSPLEDAASTESFTLLKPVGCRYPGLRAAFSKAK